MSEHDVTDERILAGIDRHLAAAEPLVPLPRAWHPDERRDGVRTGGAFRGLGVLAAAVTVVTVLALAIGPLSQRGGAGGGATPAPAASPSPSQIGIRYTLVASAGQVTREQVAAVVAVTAHRLEVLQIHGTVVPLGSDGLEVWLPASVSADLARVRGVLGATGSLTFVPLPRSAFGYVDVASGAAVAGTKELPAEGKPLDLAANGLTALFAGDAVDATSVSVEQMNGSWAVDFRLRPDAAQKFATWSTANVGSYFAVVLDGEALSVPYLQSPITGGSGRVNSVSRDSAERLALVLRGGALPVPVRDEGIDEPAQSSGSDAAP